MRERTHLTKGTRGHVDKDTIGFQGRYQDEQKIKYKCEGDDFMAYYYSDNSFACSFHF